MHFTQLTKKCGYFWRLFDIVLFLTKSLQNVQNVCKYDGVRVLIHRITFSQENAYPKSSIHAEFFRHIFTRWSLASFLRFFCTLYQLELIFTCATMPRDYRMQPTNSWEKIMVKHSLVPWPFSVSYYWGTIKSGHPVVMEKKTSCCTAVALQVCSGNLFHCHCFE